MTPIDTLQPEDIIPLSVPEIRGNEWEYIKECLDTNWVSSAGKYVTRFEESFIQQAATKYAVACVNGTASLHLALLAAGVEPDSEVLVSTLTFIAPANAVRYVGAHPVFVDADINSWQMDPSLVVDFLENHCWQNQAGELINPDSGRRVSAILPVHILGHAVDLDPIIASATRFGLPVIEDASESLGGLYKGRPLGGIGTLGCFSFNGNKMITTGGGGMLVTSNSELASNARYLSTQAKDDPIEYIHHEIGYNYRLTNIQAAIGCAQLENLSQYVQRKRQIAARYDEAFASIKDITSMAEADWTHHARWLSVISLNEDSSIDRHQLATSLSNANIQTRPLWQPMHLSPAHQNSPKLGGQIAESLQRRALCLPCSVGLREEEQERVIQVVHSVFSAS